MLATYMRPMRNNNLEIRIADFSCRRKLQYKTLVRTAVGLKFVIECSRVNKIEMVV